MEIINGIDQDDTGGDCTNINNATINNSIIGGTTPASGTFTTLEATGQLQGSLINNQMVQKSTFDILGLMTDPRFLNLQCEDPGAGTMTDASGQGHNGTYCGSMTSGDRQKLGMGWSIDPDGTDDYVDLGNGNDFSFGNGSNDEAVTWFGVCEVVDTGVGQVIISKRDNTTGTELREWDIIIDPSRKIRVIFFDESTNVYCRRLSDTGLSVGWYSLVITYDGTGGAVAADTIKIYINGSLVASTATNDASYVAMENSTTSFLIGASVGAAGTKVSLMNGDCALIGIDGSEWSAYDAHRFHQLCKGLYGL